MDDAEFEALMGRYLERRQAQVAQRNQGPTAADAQYAFGRGPMIPSPPSGALCVIYAHTPYGGWLRYDFRNGWSPLPPGTLPPVDEQMRPFAAEGRNVPLAPSRAEYEAAGGGQPIGMMPRSPGVGTSLWGD